MVAPFLAIAFASAMGATIARRAGLPGAPFFTNVAGLAAGLLLAGGVKRLGGPRVRSLAVPLGLLALLLMATTLVSPGSAGVHRWLPIGSLSLHASAAFSPWVFAASAHATSQGQRGRGLALAFALQALHVLQPDGGQALASLGAFTAIGLFVDAEPRSAPLRRARRAAPWLALGVGGVVFAWRPDNLPLVPTVEGILTLAREDGALMAALAGCALLLPWGSLVAVAQRQRHASPIGRVLAGAMAGSIAAGLAGPFPVPCLGAGAGPVVGAVTCFALARAFAAR